MRLYDTRTSLQTRWIVLASNPVLADTSALYALISRVDVFHEAASKTYEGLLRGGREMWFSSYVLVEFSGLTERRLGFSPLKSFYDSVDGVFDTFWIDDQLHHEAWAQLETRNGAGLNFVDWTVMLAARELGATIFTFDGGFRQEGAATLP